MGKKRSRTEHPPTAANALSPAASETKKRAVVPTIPSESGVANDVDMREVAPEKRAAEQSGEMSRSLVIPTP